jgi:hypothetical protein
VEVGVADAAEKDFYLNIVFARIAPWDCGGNKRRFCARSSESLRFVLAT